MQADFQAIPAVFCPHGPLGFASLVRRAGLRAFLKTIYMRRSAPVLLVAIGAGLAGCGSGGNGHFANNPRPPSPINLTVYINDHRVSLSPTSAGAGPVVFIVTNQASRAESVTILPAGSDAGQPLADTGPISPQATASVKVNLSTGAYTVSTTSSGSTQAATAATPPIQPALLHIGAQRPSSSGQLLIP